MVMKFISVIRNNWKKSIFFTGCAAYATNFFWKWHLENELMREYCLKAREFGRQTLTSTERPRKLVVFLNPAAKDGKTKYLLEKHVLPILHIAGIEIHVVRTEHEGQAKAYMGVLDNSIVDGIVVAGGDGTLSEIVTGLLRRSDDLATRIPVGVLPFGKTNSYSTKLFPKKDLEVERFCQASMAIVQNKTKSVDVMQVTPDTDSDEEKSVYLLSHIKWGIHSDIDRKKTKYWYYPGPLKQYYCYMKQALFGKWPPHVGASLQILAPCDGCKRCLSTNSPPTSESEKPRPSIWSLIRTQVQRPTTSPKQLDPRLQIENESCGVPTSLDIETPQLEITQRADNSESGDGEAYCASLELRYTPTVLNKTQFLTNQGYSLSDSECIKCSSIRVVPHTSDIWYVMDSEKYETMPAKISLLRNRINVYSS